MGINISQFNPPATVSNLVWDEDMKAGAGKIFKGDLTGNVVGNITNGGVNGYLFRSGVVSASSGILIVPAGSSVGNTPVTIDLGGNGVYCIKDNTQKCYYPSPCTIPVSLSNPPYGPGSYENNAYARSYDADGVLIDSVGNGGNLNIYGASYIILNGGTSYYNNTPNNETMSVGDIYIDADTTVIPGMVNPPTNGVFTGDVITTYRMTPRTPYAYTKFTGSSIGTVASTARDNMVLYNVLPNQLFTGTIRAYYNGGEVVSIQFLDKSWGELSKVNLTTSAADYTLPAGTNCIILTLKGGYESVPTGYIAKFDIAVV